jgi:hypothetical protein
MLTLQNESAPILVDRFPHILPFFPVWGRTMNYIAIVQDHINILPIIELRAVVLGAGLG